MFYSASIVSHFITICLLTCLLNSCDSIQEQKVGGQSGKPKKEILIYCGITMSQPVRELAELVEREKDCVIKVSYGETEWLKNTAVATKTGDIFFPGSPLYLQSMQKDGTVTETIQVGENRIVLMVRKGNPKQVQPDLRELLREDLLIVLGAPGAGSIGKETRHNLDKLDIYKQAVDKALYLGAESKALTKAMRSGDADVVVNWRAEITIGDNAEYIDIIPLPEEQTERRLLIMGLLSYSKQEELARYFMTRAGSDSGRGIFAKYGF